VIFDRLSIFGGDPAVQLLNNAAKPGNDCILCVAAAGAQIVCGACAASVSRPGFACPQCALPMPFPERCGRCVRVAPAFDLARAAFDYRFPLDRLVQRFKFAGDLAVGRWLGEELALAVAAERADVLVVPPLARSRLRSRGFNQALELARVVGVARNIAVDAWAVERVRDTSPQPGLGRGERRANLRGAFRVRNAWQGAHVAIVDDVMTTGATAEAMAHVLKEAGAAIVSVWVVARTPEPGR